MKRANIGLDHLAHMLDQTDLKWLANHATELNRLLQQVTRHSEQARVHVGECSYLDLLDERVAQAGRKSQELFDRLTSLILVGAATGKTAPVTAFLPALEPAFAHTNVVVKMPLGEIGLEMDELEDPPIRNPKGARELILVVDDDEEVLERTSEILDFEDYRIVLAKDGPEALRIYRRMGNQIALVLLDYFLPVMDGDAVFEELQAIEADVRVVLSSGFGEQAKLGSMLSRGLRGFIPKPYSHEKLIEQIRLILQA